MLTALTRLDLQNNLLTGGIPLEFAGLTELTMLMELMILKVLEMMEPKTQMGCHLDCSWEKMMLMGLKMLKALKKLMGRSKWKVLMTLTEQRRLMALQTLMA